MTTISVKRNKNYLFWLFTRYLRDLSTLLGLPVIALYCLATFNVSLVHASKLKSGAMLGTTSSGELSQYTIVYQAVYDPEVWAGDVRAYSLYTLEEEIADGQSNNSVGITAGTVKNLEWSAAKTMHDLVTSAPNEWWTSWYRQVISYNGTNGVAFNIPADPDTPGSYDLSADQLLHLGDSVDEYGPVINYLRGDKSNERPNGLNFRRRLGVYSSDSKDARLHGTYGDFNQSAPVLVETVVVNDGQGDGHDNNNNGQTDEVGEHEEKLLVGGNDGGLHVFDPNDSGRELFMYIPNLLFAEGNLPELLKPQAEFTHNSYVDGTVYYEQLGTGGPTLVVGGLQKGGKGYYALDLTGMRAGNIESTASLIVKWEYPNRELYAIDLNPGGISGSPVNLADDKGYMGYSYSMGYIVASNADVDISNTKTEYMVAFGNGYESPSGKAVLILLGLDSDGAIAWRREITTGVGNPASENNCNQCNGLSSPALIDVNEDGKVDYAYAGDLLGNMWKFDLRSDDPAKWGIPFYSGGLPQPLFTAQGAVRSGAMWLSNTQPITTEPEVILPCSAGQQGYFVIFGTGRYLEESDLQDHSGQTIYGVWDWVDDWADKTAADLSEKYLGALTLPGSYDGSLEPEWIREISNALSLNVVRNPLRYDTQGVALREQYLISTIGDTSSTAYRLISSYPVNWYTPEKKLKDPDGRGEHAGWYFNLPGTGERITSPPFVRDGVLRYVSSQVVGAGVTNNLVSISHAVNACTGGVLTEPYYDITCDREVNSSDRVNLGSEDNRKMVVPSGVYVQGRASSPALISIDKTEMAVDIVSSSTTELKVTRVRDERVGIVSWREIE